MINIFLFSFLLSVHVSISTFALLAAVSVVSASSSAGLKICEITAGIKSISQSSRKRWKIMIE